MNSCKRAVILAAGRGSRMLGLTDERPKCLVSLLGKSLLEWQLDALRGAGAEDVLVIRGYRADMLQGDFDTAENPRWAESNMVRTLLCAGEWMEREATIVSYSDIVYRGEYVAALAACDADIAICYDTQWRALWEARFDDVLGDAETFRSEDGLLKEIGSRTDDISSIQGQYMGLLKFSPDGWKQVLAFLQSKSDEEIDKLDMTGLLSSLLQEGVKIATLPVAGGWVEADSGDDIGVYERAITTAEVEKAYWSHDWR